MLIFYSINLYFNNNTIVLKKKKMLTGPFRTLSKVLVVAVGPSSRQSSDTSLVFNCIYMDINLIFNFYYNIIRDLYILGLIVFRLKFWIS